VPSPPGQSLRETRGTDFYARGTLANNLCLGVNSHHALVFDQQSIRPAPSKSIGSTGPGCLVCRTPNKFVAGRISFLAQLLWLRLLLRSGHRKRSSRRGGCCACGRFGFSRSFLGNVLPSRIVQSLCFFLADALDFENLS